MASSKESAQVEVLRAADLDHLYRGELMWPQRTVFALQYNLTSQPDWWIIHVLSKFRWTRSFSRIQK